MSPLFAEMDAIHSFDVNEVNAFSLTKFTVLNSALVS